MADYELIQKKIYYGYAQAAKRLGTDYDIYRPESGIKPLDSGNKIGTTKVSAALNLTYTKGAGYKNSLFNLIVDGSLLRHGDYLVGSNTFFVVSGVSGSPIGFQELSPIMGIKCDRKITIRAPITQQEDSYSIGPQTEYRAYTVDNSTNIYEDCPASFIGSPRGYVSSVKLPTDPKLPLFEVFLPVLPDSEIGTGYYVTDEFGSTYEIGMDERTELGWRLYLIEQGA